MSFVRLYSHYEALAIELLFSGVGFARNLVGIILRPYETYRRLVARGSLGELIYIWFVVFAYFFIASVVRVSAFRPYLLTKQFVVLISGAGLGFLMVIAVIRIIGIKLKSADNLPGIIIGWGYTLIPTVLWFFMTSLLYMILPPPRTTRLLGVSFSVLYLIFSSVLLFWKVMLLYLTIRFALKADIKKIVLVIFGLLPCFGLYTGFMYWLGIFRVPFL